MNTTNIFEKASRIKLRFASPKGDLTVEDLWDLPLTSDTGKANLDSIGTGLMRELREVRETTSLVRPAPKGKEGLLQLQFDIIKHIIDVRVAERDARAELAERRRRANELMALIQDKTKAADANRSVEDLQAELNQLLSGLPPEDA